MLNEETIEKLGERLAIRLEKLNTYTLKQIAKKIKEIKTITPSDSHKLAQIMQYGGDYDKIVKEISKISEINKKELTKIFKEVAKKDYEFAEQFYKYKNVKYIPWEENIMLQRQAELLATQTSNTYMNFANTRAIGFSVKDINGKTIFKSLDNTIKDTIDEAILSISQGETTFEDEMYSIMNQLGSSGLKYMDYSSGYSRRLDSSVRMAIKDGLRQLHTENQLQFGKEFGSDGVEVTVHAMPAPDHAEVQGRQFSNEEFDKFQNDEDAVDYKGKKFPSIAEETGYDRRSIGQYNCYHTIYSIVLGVSEPNYTDEELQKIIDQTNETITFDGKEYNMYECTQLQRKLETEIRKQKDLQIMGKASGNQELIDKSEKRINILTNKYFKLSEKSGLPTKLDRLRVDEIKNIR